MSKNKHVVRVTYNPSSELFVEAHKNDWVDIDVTEWTGRDYIMLQNANMIDRRLGEYLERYSVDWSITGVNGKPVKHPGFGAEREAWLEAYASVPIALMRWLMAVPFLALNEASQPPKKV